MRASVRVRRWGWTLSVAILMAVAVVVLACTKTQDGVGEPATEATEAAVSTQLAPTEDLQSPATAIPTISAAPTDSATLPPAATPTIALTNTPEPTSTATPLPDGALVHIGDTVYVVDLAVTPEERSQGLSSRPSMPEDRGMLFVYEADGARTFWMPDMHFPLDMVWIREDCVVAGVTADVPNPPLDKPRDELEHYPSAGMVRFVLELNAGQAVANGIESGGPVEFGGEIAGKWGC